MYSALKVGGKKLVDLAREGKEVKREPRKVEIFHIDIIDMDLPRVKFTAKVSKGTYIRTLCHDIGEKLSVGGCMESLVRKRVDRFDIDGAITLKQLESERDNIDKRIMSVEEYFSFLPKINTSPDFDKYLHNGNKLKFEKIKILKKLLSLSMNWTGIPQRRKVSAIFMKGCSKKMRTKRKAERDNILLRVF